MKQNVIIAYDPGNEQTGWVVALEDNSKLIYKNKDLNTICLKKRISKKFKAIESSSYKQEFRYNPSYIRLLPNIQYVIRHNGMGAKVNIIKYFYTDSSGNLHYKCDEKSGRKLQEP